MLGNNKNALTPRMAGVMVTQPGNGERGTPQKLIGVIQAEVFLVEYTDARGQVEAGLFFKIGDRYMTTSDTAAWCSSLKPMTAWLRKQVDEAREQQAPMQIAKEDAVDVLDP